MKMKAFLFRCWKSFPATFTALVVYALASLSMETVPLWTSYLARLIGEDTWYVLACIVFGPLLLLGCIELWNLAVSVRHLRGKRLTRARARDAAASSVLCVLPVVMSQSWVYSTPGARMVIVLLLCAMALPLGILIFSREYAEP